jgi:hypothetical protein
MLELLEGRPLYLRPVCPATKGHCWMFRTVYPHACIAAACFGGAVVMFIHINQENISLRSIMFSIE